MALLTDDLQGFCDEASPSTHLSAGLQPRQGDAKTPVHAIWEPALSEQPLLFCG